MNGLSRLVLTLLIVGAFYWFLIKPNLPADFSFTPPPEVKEVLRGVGHAPAPPPRQEVQAPKKKTTGAKKKVQSPKKKTSAPKKKPVTPPAEETKTVIVTKDLPPSHAVDDNDDYRGGKGEKFTTSHIDWFFFGKKKPEHTLVSERIGVYCNRS